MLGRTDKVDGTAREDSQGKGIMRIEFGESEPCDAVFFTDRSECKFALSSCLCHQKNGPSRFPAKNPPSDAPPTDRFT